MCLTFCFSQGCSSDVDLAFPALDGRNRIEQHTESGYESGYKTQKVAPQVGLEPTTLRLTVDGKRFSLVSLILKILPDRYVNCGKISWSISLVSVLISRFNRKRVLKAGTSLGLDSILIFHDLLVAGGAMARERTGFIVKRDGRFTCAFSSRMPQVSAKSVCAEPKACPKQTSSERG